MTFSLIANIRSVKEWECDEGIRQRMFEAEVTCGKVQGYLIPLDASAVSIS